MLASVTHILPLVNIRRARLLPSKGNVLARVGQKVTATEVVAEAPLRRKHLMLDLRTTLGVSSSAARRLIERKTGEKVQEGDIIAESGGLLKKVLRAPADGTIVSINGGQILLEVTSQVFRLKAALPGDVVEIIPDRGVIIESSGLLMQAVWGNNRIGDGKLAVLADNPAKELTREQLKPELHGAVILSGFCTSSSVLKAAAETQIQGLILGGLTSDLLPATRGLDFPVLIMDGFGKLSLNSVAYRLLKTHEGREVSLNGSPRDPATGDRPELVIPLPASGETAPETDFFKPGQTVRIHSSPYTGQIGKVNQVISGMSQLPNGLRVPAAKILLETNESILVPLANMDVIE